MFRFFASSGTNFSYRSDLRARYFSSSKCHEDHYKTLGVPQHATKAQIKSHFYQLSKLHHPDVATDARSKEVFNAITEAYSILGDDRERRFYDRALAQQQQRPTGAPQTYHPRAPGSYRGHRATHAWEYSYRPRGTSQRTKNPSADWYQYTHPGPQQHKHPGQHYSSPGPELLYHNINAHTRGRHGQRANEEEREMDKVRRVSGLMRAMQLMGLITLSVTVFGSFSHTGR